MKRLTEQERIELVKHSPSRMQSWAYVSEAVQIAALGNSLNSIQYIRFPTEKVQLMVVSADGEMIWHFDNPNEAVQLAAVRQNAYALKSIKKPSKSVQLEAVKRNGHLINYVVKPTSEMLQCAWESIKAFDKGKTMLKLPLMLKDFALQENMVPQEYTCITKDGSYEHIPARYEMNSEQPTEAKTNESFMTKLFRAIRGY